MSVIFHPYSVKPDVMRAADGIRYPILRLRGRTTDGESIVVIAAGEFVESLHQTIKSSVLFDTDLRSSGIAIALEGETRYQAAGNENKPYFSVQGFQMVRPEVLEFLRARSRAFAVAERSAELKAAGNLEAAYAEMAAFMNEFSRFDMAAGVVTPELPGPGNGPGSIPPDSAAARPDEVSIPLPVTEAEATGNPVAEGLSVEEVAISPVGVTDILPEPAIVEVQPDIADDTAVGTVLEALAADGSPEVIADEVAAAPETPQEAETQDTQFATSSDAQPSDLPIEADAAVLTAGETVAAAAEPETVADNATVAKAADNPAIEEERHVRQETEASGETAVDASPDAPSDVQPEPEVVVHEPAPETVAPVTSRVSLPAASSGLPPPRIVLRRGLPGMMPRPLPPAAPATVQGGIPAASATVPPPVAAVSSGLPVADPEAEAAVDFRMQTAAVPAATTPPPGGSTSSAQRLVAAARSGTLPGSRPLPGRSGLPAPRQQPAPATPQIAGMRR